VGGGVGQGRGKLREEVYRRRQGKREEGFSGWPEGGDILQSKTRRGGRLQNWDRN